MNASQHINALSTGGSPAAQLLSALSGQGQSGAGTATGGNGAFEAMLNNIPGSQAQAPATGGSPTLYIGNATGMGANAQTTGGNGTQNSLVTLLQSMTTGETTAAGEDGTALTLPADILSQLSQITSVNADGQLVITDPAAFEELTGLSGDIDLTALFAAADMAGLMPTSAQGAMGAMGAMGETQPVDQRLVILGLLAGNQQTASAGLEAAGQQGTTAGQAQSASAQATTNSSSEAQPQADDLEGFLKTLSAEQRASITAALRQVAANTGQQNAVKTATDAVPQTHTAGVSAHMSQELKRDTALQVTDDTRTSKKGASQLLSAGTTASVLGTNAATGASGNGGIIGQGSNGSGTMTGQPTTTKTASNTQTANNNAGQAFGIQSAASIMGDLSLGDSGVYGDIADISSRPTSMDQLDSSITKMARAPMTNQAPPSQVAIHISKAMEQGVNRFTVQLSPASLGDIEVNLSMTEDGVVQAALRVEKPETLQLLERDSKILEQALEDAGLKPDAGSLSFSLKHDSDNFAHEGDQQHAAPKSDQHIESELEEQAAQAARSLHDGQLDVWI